MLVLKGLVSLHRTVQLQLLQRSWLGHRLGLLWYWMVCLGNERRLFCRFWDCIQVLHFGLLLTTMATPFLLRSLYFAYFWMHTLFYCNNAAAAAKSLQSCPTLCDPIDSSPLGSTVPGILQARTLEWAAISFSNAWRWKVKVKSLSRVRLFATPWTAAYQAHPSMEFSRQEYWSRVPLPSPFFPLRNQLFSRVLC